MYSTDKTDIYALIGRVLLSVIFIISASAKIVEWNGTVQMMAAKGLPLPSLLLAVATFVELAGGIGMLLGIFSRVSALALFVYLIPVTLIMHNFWSVSATQMNMQLVNFLKNLAIMGGLSMLAGYGPGRYSIGTEKHLYDDEYVARRRGDVGVASKR